MPEPDTQCCRPRCGDDEDPNPFPHWIVDRIDEIVAQPEVPLKPFFLLESSCTQTLAISPDDQIRPAAAVTHQACARPEVCVGPEPEAEPKAKPAKKPAARTKEES